MGDAESAFLPSKKRAAGREISKDNPGLDDDDDAPEQESGTFKKASDEVLATRRIVKVRRQQTPAAAHSNPFANISFVPPSTESAKPTEAIVKMPPVAEEDTKSTEKTDEPEVESAGEKGDSVNKRANPESTDEKENGEVGEAEEEAKKDNGLDDTAPSASTTPLSSFQQLSSNQNAFTGLSGPGFSNSAFSFSSTPKDGGFGKSFPAFNFGNSGNRASSLFGTGGTSAGTKSEASSKPSMPEVPVETGEENEKAVFTCDAVLFEYLEGSWKERGKGELKVNVSTTGPEKARLVMRAKGNYRLILNASLYPDMKFANMDKRGITFACMNSTGEGKDGLSTFALKFKDGSVVEEFRMNVMAHTGKTTAVLKTPENSPQDV